MSIVSNSIINADAEARYLSPGELDQPCEPLLVVQLVVKENVPHRRPLCGDQLINEVLLAVSVVAGPDQGQMPWTSGQWGPQP